MLGGIKQATAPISSQKDYVSRTGNRHSRPVAPIIQTRTMDVKERSPGRLVDRIALVTGGSKGIGKAAALKFASEGAKVNFMIFHHTFFTSCVG